MTKMKILWVKPGKLLPLDTGGKLRTYNILRQLTAAHELTFLSYYEGMRDEVYERDLLRELPSSVPVCTASTGSTRFGRYLDFLRRALWRAPYTVSRFTAPEVQRIIQEWISQHRYDVAVCDFLHSTMNFPKQLETPTALFQHNVETLLWKRRVEYETKWIERMVSKYELAKMMRYEPQQAKRFHHVIAVSESDRQAMSGMVDPSHISVVPTGVDLSKYQYDPELRPSVPLVMFVGSMDWQPNIDGVEFFCQQIWPRVMAEIPSARFRVVGRNPHPRVEKLRSDSVEITGTVSSVVDHLREAAVIVVPLRMGGGTRIKIYEGMAMGKATVATAVGAEGLDVQHGRDILLEDDPSDFARAIVALLQDDEMRRRYEAAAAATARKYDWSVIAHCFENALARTIAEASRQNPITAQGQGSIGN